MIKEIAFTETYQIRQQVMNPERDISDMYRPGDETGRHFGYFRESNLIGVISFYPETESGELSSVIWRIRGMAVYEDFQGKGIGKQLFKFGIIQIKPMEIWLNSRKNAVGFYKTMGFISIKETKINHPEPGIRYRMKKQFTYSE